MQKPIELGLKNFKNELDSLRAVLEVDLLDLEEKERQLDQEYNIDMEYLKKNLPDCLSINVGGEIFKISKETILKNKQSLIFYLIIRTDIQELKRTTDSMDYILYIDISSTNFEHVINFMKYKFCDLGELSLEEKKDLLETAKYLELSDMVEFISDKHLPIEIVDYTTNGPYFLNYGMQIVGDLNPKVLNSKDSYGVTSMSPAWFIFELNKEIVFNSLSCIGFIGNSSFSNTNGSSAKVLTSVNGKDFIEVGQLGAINDTLTTHKLISSKAKYIKFESSSYIGFSYIEIIKQAV